MASLGKIALASLPLFGIAPRAAQAQEPPEEGRPASLPVFVEREGDARFSGKLSLRVTPLGGDATLEALQVELRAELDALSLRVSLAEEVASAPALSPPSSALGVGLAFGDEVRVALSADLTLEQLAGALRFNLTL